MRGVLMALLSIWLTLPAHAQEAGDSIVRVQLGAGEGPADTVRLLHATAGELATIPVPEGCDQCVLIWYGPLPDGALWAVAENENGTSPDSNVRDGAHYLTVYERADVNGDGSPGIADIFLVNRMIFSEPPDGDR